MKHLRKSLLAITLSAVAGAASAQLTTNLPVANPKALAMGNAVTADPPGVDSIHFNPAGLTRIKGGEFQAKVLAADLSSTTRFGNRAPEVQEQLKDFKLNRIDGAFDDKLVNTTSHTSDPMLMLPGMGLTKLPVVLLPFGGVAVNMPDMDITFATAVYSPNGFGYSRDEDDPGRYQGVEASIIRLTYLSPSIAFKLSETLSFGASFGLSWQGAGLDLNMRAPNFATFAATQVSDYFLPSQNCAAPTQPIIQALCNPLSPYDDLLRMKLELESAYSPSANVGFLWEPTPYMSFGLTYQSEGRSDLKGPYSMEYSEKWQEFFGRLSPITRPLGLSVGKARDKGVAELEFIEPQRIAIGTSVRVMPRLKVNVDWKWADYGVWETLDVKFSEKIDFLRLAALLQPENATVDELRIPRHYRSVWSWAIGAEYQLTNQIALRAGYEPRKSAVPKDKVDILLPLYDADLFTAGFAYQLSENQLIEAAAGYLTSKYSIGNGPGEQSTNFNMYENNVQNVIYNPYTGVSAKVDTRVILLNLGYTSKF